ncbi:hypothetical protein FHW67_003515 [Herbaspirillum sp. Sphag1AN]|nr:hypothetical protein [Herbaspirillum sp. Sphag1AN]MBB3247245.1 hypothetical protein [Herbaspirillum sp. Sphag64]
MRSVEGGKYVLTLLINMLKQFLSVRWSTREAPGSNTHPEMLTCFVCVLKAVLLGRELPPPPWIMVDIPVDDCGSIMVILQNFY